MVMNPPDNMFQAIIEEMNEGVIFLDAEDRIRYLNPAAERIRRISAAKFIGRPIHDLHPPRVHALVDELLNCLKNGTAVNRHRVIQAQGRYFDNTYTAVRGPAGDYRGTLLVSRDITEKKDLSEENLQLKKILARPFTADTFVAESPALKAALAMVEAVAPLDSTVLLTGESGTGKELFVARLHSLSPRRGGPLVNVNCAALPEQLVESELFGHVKGAFTGAVGSRPGRFLQAQGGTLFLDEIGDLPAAAQAKLLRVLQERSVQAVGGKGETPVDARIVAATNRDLEEDVRRGRFRADLYFRLNVIPIHIPPLRRRPEDILPLAEHFLAHFARRMGKPTPVLSAEARARLLAYDFPGNVRQLKHAMERAVALGAGEVVELADMPAEFGGGQPAHPVAAVVGQGTLKSALQDYERHLLLAALRRHGGHRAATARALGISRKALWEKLQRLDIVEASLSSNMIDA
ncbi:sigma-54 interaction domain-containing protein [Trichloromonas sp.]|uniref:sigma-54 interaction domain-containing protein n=1 Tax=Trichloromonas sp. TaxID=3069249 RepID=UPI002A43EC2C|nr:sigma 54-interacting transcriptional regulator [Trichloromonas sp.]